jgi:hypothetical protein
MVVVSMTKKLVLEFTLVPESESASSRKIIDDVYCDIMEGRCIIPWCGSVLKVIRTE